MHQRIAVVGTCGSGKSFVAEHAAERLGSEYICNDAIIWAEDWTRRAEDEVRAELERATAEPRWIYDGNLAYTKQLDRIVLDRADTIVWLDLSRVVVHGQILLRTLRLLVTQQELWHGNRQTLRSALSRESMVWVSITTYADRKRRYTAMRNDPRAADKRFWRLESRAAIDRWLAELRC